MPKIIAFYLIIIVALIIEIIFLFQIPYYDYSKYLKYLKIIRILSGFLIFLIDVYLQTIQIAEKLFGISNQVSKDKYYMFKKNFNIFDKILIIGGFVLSISNLILNLIGVGLTTKRFINEKKNKNKTYLQKINPSFSLLLLFENSLISIGWIHFSIYYGFNMNNFLFIDKKYKSNHIDNRYRKNDNYRNKYIRNNNSKNNNNNNSSNNNNNNKNSSLFKRIQGEIEENTSQNYHKKIESFESKDPIIQ